MQGVAFSMRYNMNVVINNEYFVKYRATAMGVSLAGSTCGVFLLKPIIAHVLDTSDHHFRNAYLTLAVIMSINIILSLFIRKPRSHAISPEDSPAIDGDFNHDANSLSTTLISLLKNPGIHCIWIMQTVYFYISRTYTIFIVDYGIDKGFTKVDSRNLLDYWVYGEIGGRLLLGAFVDSRLISLKWNIVLVNLLVGISGFGLILAPIIFGHSTEVINDIALKQVVLQQDNSFYYYSCGIAITLTAALSSLVNMLIVPFGQEYLGKKNVPWAFAMGSIITSGFLLLRPSLIGLSRDYLKTYDLLIMVMSVGPLIYAVAFIFIEPLLSRYANIHQTSPDHQL